MYHGGGWPLQWRTTAAALYSAGMNERIASGRSYRLGRYVLDPWRQLLDGEKPVAVGGKALELLSVLAEAGGDLVTKDELMAAVWPRVVVEENAIQVHISAARRALGDEAQRLSTARGLGYRLQVDPGPAVPGPAATVHIASLAVLAFANLTGDPGSDYVADGIAEELLTTLSRTTSLRIPARTSSFAYRGRSTDVRTIGRELGVGAVLEGSLRRSGERIRVTVQLIDTKSGYHLWAQNFERSDDDLLALQDELAAAIARVLHLQLAPANFRTNDPAALRLNLQARALSARLTPDALERAIALQRAAIARDPSYADAWTGLAGTLMVGTMTGALPLDQRIEARARADEAIRLDRGAASPYAIAAVLDAVAGRWRDAEQGFTAAMELDKHNGTARSARALHVLAPAGLIEEARVEIDLAIADSPAELNLHLTKARLATVGNDIAGMEAALEMARLLGAPEESGVVMMIRSDLARRAGDWQAAGDRAVQGVRQWSLLDAPGDFELVRSVFAVAAGQASGDGLPEAITAIAERTDRDGRLWRVPAAAGHLFWWLTLLDANNHAANLVQRMIEAWRRTGHLATLSLGHLWRQEAKALRDSPRFDALVADLGLPDLWRRIGPPGSYSHVTGGAKDRGAGGTAAG